MIVILIIRNNEQLIKAKCSSAPITGWCLFEAGKEEIRAEAERSARAA